MSMFPEDDPLAQQIEAGYRQAWAELSPDLRDRLRAGVESLEGDDVRQLIGGPHPLVTLTYWLDKPESARWNISHTFAEWARTEAPRED